MTAQDIITAMSKLDPNQKVLIWQADGRFNENFTVAEANVFHGTTLIGRTVYEQADEGAVDSFRVGVLQID